MPTVDYCGVCCEEKTAECMLVPNLCLLCQRNGHTEEGIPYTSPRDNAQVLRCEECRERKALRFFTPAEELCHLCFLAPLGPEGEIPIIERPSNEEVAQNVSSAILDLLDRGELPPWKRGFQYPNPRNAFSGHEYQGINYLITLAQQIRNDWNDSRWLTKHQVLKEGGDVREGEIPTTIYVYRGWVLIRVHHVYNLNQTTVALSAIPDIPSEATAEHILEAMSQRPDINYNPAMAGPAHYLPQEDLIVMPTIQQFERPEWYYDTLFHELAHSTGHHSRLGRFQQSAFPNGVPHSRGREELIAEMTAGMLCHKAGIGQRTIENTAAYIQGWAETIRADRDLILQASYEAEQALKFIAP